MSETAHERADRLRGFAGSQFSTTDFTGQARLMRDALLAGAATLEGLPTQEEADADSSPGVTGAVMVAPGSRDGVGLCLAQVVDGSSVDEVEDALLAGVAIPGAQAKAPPKVLGEAWGLVDKAGKLTVVEDTIGDGPLLFETKEHAENEAGQGERVVRVQVSQVEVPS